MEKMRTSRLFTKTLILIVILFGIIATATSVLSGWTLYRSLTDEFRSKGVAIAQSVADSSGEILLNRDLSTVQAIIDQFGEISGVAYVFVADAQGEIVSHTFVPAVPQEVLPLIRQSRSGAPSGDLITTTLQVEGLGNFIHIYAPILAGVAGFVHVGMDQGFIQAQIWSTVANQQGLIFAIFILSIVLAYMFVNRISKPLNLLANYTHSLATHDFAAGLNIPAAIEALPQKSRDEIGKLAESFMDMERTLQRYLKDLEETTASKERIESELKIAHEIQMSMVPKIFPPFPERGEFDIFATLVPAKEVGGDLYDFFFIDDDHLCFAVGDVSGKGVPASLFMAVTKTLFRATASNGGSPGEILARLNAEICRDNESCMFVTFFCAILNIRTGQVDYSNGGHNLPYYLYDGGVSPLKNTGGRALGLVEQSPYPSGQVVLGPGEALLLYTDGVTEAMDLSETLYSDQRLERFLTSNRGSAPRQMIGDLVGDVRSFAGAAPQSDDITALALRYFGTTANMSETLQIKLNNKVSELERFNQILTEFCQRHDLTSKVIHDLNLALEEILTNIISYGYTDNRDHEIRVSLSVQPGEVKAEVEDDGRPFNPLEVPEPNTAKPLEERTIGGLGIHLVRKLTDGLEYQRQEEKNRLVMKKHLL
jgi:sigma-B regulation protein RsbU (phosphoserine phosphatase)